MLNCITCLHQLPYVLIFLTVFTSFAQDEISILITKEKQKTFQGNKKKKNLAKFNFSLLFMEEMTTTIFFLNHFFTLTYTNKNKSKVYLGEKILIILLLMQH